jgi:Fe-S cluster biogenesis protein NfuA
MPEKREFHARTEQIEQLVKTLEATADPQVHAAALELMQSIMELHGAGLERMLELLTQSSEGERVSGEFAQDDLVSGLLLLHGLHPEDIQTRVLRALDKVRPYLQSHGGDVQMLGLHDGILRLRLKGSCGSCSSSSATLKNAVEEAVVEAAPDVVQIIAEQPVEEINASQLVVLK